MAELTKTEQQLLCDARAQWITARAIAADNVPTNARPLVEVQRLISRAGGKAAQEAPAPHQRPQETPNAQSHSEIPNDTHKPVEQRTDVLSTPRIPWGLYEA